VPRTYPRVEMNDDADKSHKHRLNWARAIMGREKSTCPIEYASRLTENMPLGVVALRTGSGAEDRLRRRRPAGDQHLRRPTSTSTVEYREGWKL
jgi:hypothetical protein